MISDSPGGEKGQKHTMRKYKVSGIYGVSVPIGEFEADSPDAAIAMAEESDDTENQITLCHQCEDVTGDSLTLGDMFAELVEDEE